ncbi:MAG: hypothetical protein KAY78_05685 [Pseudomonadales bacterium]|jgi:hypothetical protein|nr:hypothetical protein [Pseudomonadales bacterium]
MGNIRQILVSVAVLCAGLAGCAGNDNALPNTNVFRPTPLQSSSNGMLYIYRPEASTPGVAKPLRFSYPEVLVDDRSVGVIEYNRYLSVELPPGQHKIRLTGLTEKAKDWETRDIYQVVTITPGDSTFRRFKIEFDLDNMNLFQPKSQYRIFLTPVDANDAIYEIRYTRPMK